MVNALASHVQFVFRKVAFDKGSHLLLAIVLVVFEALFGVFIVERIKYTEIDWIAYMQEVEGFLNGTLDYDCLEGQTGPCVYPAGFLYVYAILYYLTSGGQQIRMAQYIFLGVYLTTLVFVFHIYRQIRKVPPYALLFMCLLSYRIHSIYLLRMFNDTIAMLFLYASVSALFVYRFTSASILFSFAVSVKMNIVLYAPGFLVVLLYYRGILETFGHLCECATVQLLVGTPFLFHNAAAYLSRAFNFGRQFLYVWTVNWRLLPEDIFLDRKFQVFLLASHVVLLSVMLFKFIRSRGGPMEFLSLHPPLRRTPCKEDSDAVIFPLFVSNFVGIAFSRSLHYQFYVWYFHTLVYLCWSIDFFASPFRLLLLGLIEICWNTYPSTVTSSLLLHICHLFILIGLIRQPLTTVGHGPSMTARDAIRDLRHRGKAKQS